MCTIMLVQTTEDYRRLSYTDENYRRLTACHRILQTTADFRRDKHKTVHYRILQQAMSYTAIADRHKQPHINHTNAIHS